MATQTYKQRNSTVEAIKWDGTNLKEIIEFCPAVIDLGCDSSQDPPISWPIQIGHRGDSDYCDPVNLGDYIMKDRGYCYLIPAWIFENMYDSI